MTDYNEESNTGTDDTSHTPLSGEWMPQTSEEPTDTELKLDLTAVQALGEGKTLRIPKNPHFTRKDVVNSFQQAFELVGGLPRLAIWANENYGEFVKMYSKLLPSQASSALGEANVLRIETCIPKGPLDE